MSHFSYTEERKDLRPLIDAICGWAELNWQIGGIAFHKVRDLEERLSKLIPDPSKLFRFDDIKDRFDLVRSGKMTKHEFLAKYPEKMVWVHDHPDDGTPWTFSVDNDILSYPTHNPKLGGWSDLPHVDRLYKSFSLLSKLVDFEDAEKLGHGSHKEPTQLEWAKVFDEARSIIEKERNKQ